MEEELVLLLLLLLLKLLLFLLPFLLPMADTPIICMAKLLKLGVVFFFKLLGLELFGLLNRRSSLKKFTAIIWVDLMVRKVKNVSPPLPSSPPPSSSPSSSETITFGLEVELTTVDPKVISESSSETASSTLFFIS